MRWLVAFLLVIGGTFLVPVLWPLPSPQSLQLPADIVDEITESGSRFGLLVVEFGDVESLASRHNAIMMADLRERYSIDYVWLHFPSELHIDGQVAAVLLECARDQGRFDEALSAFIQLEDVTQQSLVDAMGGDAQLAWGCAQSGEKESIVGKHLEWASQLRLDAAPIVFVDGKLVTKPYTEKSVERAIQESS